MMKLKVKTVFTSTFNHLVLLSIVVMTIIGCKDDGDDYSFVNVKVFTENTHRIVPRISETVTEQYLFKDAYHEGATFETVTEQVLVRQSYTTFQISEASEVSLIVNDATGNRLDLPCVVFYAEEDFIEEEVPSVYRTRTSQRLHQDGTGTFHEAEYREDSYIITDMDARLEAIGSGERDFEIFEFHVPIGIDLNKFIAEQLIEQNIVDCLQPGSFEIVE